MVENREDGELEFRGVKLNLGSKVLTVDAAQRKLLDEEYARKGLNGIEDKIRYLREMTGLLWTVHEGQHKRETILYSLECTYVHDRNRRHPPN